MVAINPQRLRPGELCRLLNSTPLGEVINERQLHRHRTRAGFRIGDEKRIDLFRYAAWLFHARHAEKPEANGDPYAELKERARARNIALSLAGRDIGELPEVVNPDRKEKAALDFRYFCESYFPNTFTLAWSPDHLRVIGRLEEAVLKGGLFAMAMPRGSGKTSICESACVWAVLYGHREFVCLIGSDEGRAGITTGSIASSGAPWPARCWEPSCRGHTLQSGSRPENGWNYGRCGLRRCGWRELTEVYTGAKLALRRSTAKPAVRAFITAATLQKRWHGRPTAPLLRKAAAKLSMLPVQKWIRL